jgi:hypothetical protein
MGIIGTILSAWIWVHGARSFISAWRQNSDYEGRILLVAAGMSAIAIGLESLFHTSGVTDISKVSTLVVLLVLIHQIPESTSERTIASCPSTIFFSFDKLRISASIRSTDGYCSPRNSQL